MFIFLFEPQTFLILLSYKVYEFAKGKSQFFVTLPIRQRNENNSKTEKYVCYQNHRTY